MKHVDTLIHGKHVIPVDDHGRTLADTAIAVHEGDIVDILPSAAAKSRYSSEASYTYDHHLVIPGLINAHTHAGMSLFRGMASDLPLMEWLNDHIWPAETKWCSEEFVRIGTRLAMAEMIRGGITCFNDMYFFAEIAAEEVMQSGMRAHLGMILLDFPTAYARDANEYLDKGLELYQRLRSPSRVQCTLAPHAPYTVSDGPLKRVAELAHEHGLPVHIHLHETENEITMSLEQYRCRPLARLHELGLVNDRLVAVHMTQLQDEEIELLAEVGASIVHCPQSNLKLASGFCPVQKLLDGPVNVTLGTDSCSSNDDLDLLGEMQTAALLAKGVAGDAAALPARTALQCATINAARALGVDDVTGSLEVGKAADITVIDVERIEAQPLYDPVGHAVYATQRSQVCDVWVEGRLLLHDGQLQTLDGARILNDTRDWNKKISSGKNIH